MHYNCFLLFLLPALIDWNVKSHNIMQISGVTLPSEQLLFHKTYEPFYALEGQMTNYEVRLSEIPISTVYINFSSTDGKTSIHPKSVAFNYTNWNLFQMLQITSVQDFFLLDSPYQSILSLEMHSTDEHYNFISLVNLDVSYMVRNTDVASATLTLDTSKYPYPLRIPIGRFADYFVGLASKPLENVTMLFESSIYISIGINSLYFTPANWNLGQLIRIYALTNKVSSDKEPALSGKLKIIFSSLDPKFNTAITLFDVPLQTEQISGSEYLQHASLSWKSIVTTSKM